MNVTVQRPSGTTCQVVADYVLGCDGYGGVTREQIGASYGGRSDRHQAGVPGRRERVNPPYGGHGYNTSVGDSVNIAWKLAFVLHGWAPPALLDSYEPERRGVVEQTVASAAANMAAMPADLTADASAIRRAKSPEFFNLGLVLGYGYAGSPVIQGGAGAGAGSGRPAVAEIGTYTPSAEPGPRLPHCWLPDGNSL